MVLFDSYEHNKGKYRISPILLGEYDLRRFDWQRNCHIVVQRVIERGRVEDYFAAFDLYGGGRRLPRGRSRGCHALGAGYEFRLCSFPS